MLTGWNRLHTFSWNTGLTLAATAAVVALVLTLSLSSRVANKLENLQLENNITKVESIILIVDQNLQHLTDYTTDYARWNDTSSYVQSPDPAYVETNFQPATLATTPAQLVAIYDLDRRLIFARTVDEQGNLLPTPGGLDQPHLVSSFSRLTTPGNFQGGIRWFGNRPFLFVVCPVTNSLGAPPIRGYFLFGSVIGPRMLEKIHTLARVPIFFTRPSSIPSGGRPFHSPVLGSATIQIDPVVSSSHSLARVFFTPAGSPPIELRIELPTRVWLMGQTISENIRYAFILVSLGFALFAILAVIEIQRRRKELRKRIAEGEQLRQALERAERLQQEAEAADRAKSAFLATMSHEIRTPLNAIIGYADLLKNIDAGPEANQGLRSIRESGTVLLRVINDVLDFSRAEAGRVSIHHGPFDLRTLVGEVVALFRGPASDKGNHLATSIAPDLPVLVVGDADRLRQILYNLLSNSVKFTLDGEIHVSISRRERLSPAAVDDQATDKFFLVITVQDEGVGISPGDEGLLFEPFSQVDSTLTRRFQGSGLGLAICRRLCRLMDGDLTFSRPPVRGSIFEAVIASGTAVIPPEPPAPAAPVSRQAVSDLSVIVVDDNPINARLLSTVLRRSGIEPRVASGGQQAIDLYRETPPDLILMDIQMPEMDGLEATRRIRDLEISQSLPRCRIVAVTANVLTANRTIAMEAGMDDFLGKPIRTEQIDAVLANLQAGPGSDRPSS